MKLVFICQRFFDSLLIKFLQTSVCGVLAGMSLVRVEMGLGMSLNPVMLYNSPVPSGRGKKIEPWRGGEGC